jgi:hypothetical protein
MLNSVESWVIALTGCRGAFAPERSATCQRVGCLEPFRAAFHCTDLTACADPGCRLLSAHVDSGTRSAVAVSALWVSRSRIGSRQRSHRLEPSASSAFRSTEPGGVALRVYPTYQAIAKPIAVNLPGPLCGSADRVPSLMYNDFDTSILRLTDTRTSGY